MKHLKTYSQINESKQSDLVESLLSIFSKKIDAKKLSNLLLPNRELLLPYINKYCKGGVINGDLIHEDFKKLNFTANESNDYADDTSNNVILRLLYKMFVRWPKSLVKGIADMFYETVIENWKYDKFVSIMASIMWLGAAILIYILGYFVYSITEHEISGLKKGIVKSEDFQAAHSETTMQTVIVGKTTMSIPQTRWINDRWFIEVEGSNGRKEVWVTYNKQRGENIQNGQEVINDKDWTWEETEKK